MRTLVPHGRFGYVFLCVILAVIAACSVQKPDSAFHSSKSTQEEQPKISAAQLQHQAKEKEPVRVNYLVSLEDITRPEIYIYKEKRRLYVMQSNVMVRDYPIGLGFKPAGDKENGSDGRTPEGDFVICLRGPVDAFKNALVINYPDKQHAERALFSGAISQPEFKEILAAGGRNAVPPWNTKLGGRLYIHDGGAYTDWTQGDIALYASDMEELFKIASTGTPVHIRP